jgi:transposase
LSGLTAAVKKKRGLAVTVTPPGWRFFLQRLPVRPKKPFVLRLHESLADREHAVTEQLLSSPAMNVDETSLRVDRKNHWIHVYSAGDFTLKHLHRKGGKEAIESIKIIPRYGGVIIHDCWSSYLSYNHCTHGLCGSHLLR